MNPDEEALHGGPDARGAVPHDFSTNANACGACPMALQALAQADPSRYPDPRYTALREALGRFHGVAAERIVIAASASEFIARITAAVAQQGGRGVWLPRHGYGDYLRAASAWGSTRGANPNRRRALRSRGAAIRPARWARPSRAWRPWWMH